MIINQLVNDLTRKHKTTCPFELATRMNINVRFLDLPDGCRGYYFKTLRRRFIAINNSLTDEWQRFVCAHEIGHDRLHKGVGYYFVEKNTLFDPGKFERQANRFAVQLLLNMSVPETDETIDSFFMRNGIPLDMKRYYS